MPKAISPVDCGVRVEVGQVQLVQGVPGEDLRVLDAQVR
jgi:hypothetical protein